MHFEKEPYSYLFEMFLWMTLAILIKKNQKPTVLLRFDLKLLFQSFFLILAFVKNAVLGARELG